MNVFQAQPQDVKKILPLYLGYLEYFEMSAEPAAAETFLTERLVLGQGTLFYVEHEGKPIAFALLYPLFCSLNMKRTWMLHDLFVAPEARKRGVAKLLLTRIEQLAHETHSFYTMLFTTVENTRAHALYESNDYERGDTFYTYTRETK